MPRLGTQRTEFHNARPEKNRYADSNAFFFVKYVTVIFVTLTNLWIPSGYVPFRLHYLNWSSVTPLPMALVLLIPPCTICNKPST